MPLANFSDEYSSGSGVERFPALKLTEGERARIYVPKQEVPWVEWVHRLDFPKITDGVAEREERKRWDGSTFIDYVKDFLRNGICTGDEEVIQDKGADADGCPACKASTENEHVPGPVRRFAMNVVKYKVRQGEAANFAVQIPFMAEVVLWGYPQKTQDKLIGINREFPLSEHDLLLGPPEKPAYFQRFEIKAASQVGWREIEGASHTLSLLWSAANLATDDQKLYACGTKVNLAKMASDVAFVQRKYAEAERSTGTATTGAELQQGPAQQQAFQQGVEALLETPAQSAPASQTSSDFADPFAANSAQPASSAMHPAEAAAAARDERSGDPFAATPQSATRQESAQQAAQEGHGGGTDEFYSAATTSNPQAVIDDPFATPPAAGTSQPASAQQPAPGNTVPASTPQAAASTSQLAEDQQPKKITDLFDMA